MDTAMQNPSPSSSPLHAEVDETCATAPAEDPAGGIVLSGRNRACARTRVLAGMLLTSGVIAALGVMDTTSSLGPHIS
jgi:hypothetical protein